MLESLTWEKTGFITLTYDDESVPMTDKCAVFDGKVQLPYTLRKDDLQRFFKRLRKRLDSPIRYYACGEYGSRTFRPHYHFIGFGLDSDDRETIEDAWPFGIVDIGDLTMASCNYVAGYVQKKLYGKLADDYYGYREKPFSCMSKGLGKAYFIEHLDELLDDGFVQYRDSKLVLPRYFWTMCVDDFGIDLSDIKREKILRRLSDESIEARRLGMSPTQFMGYEARLRDAKDKMLKRADEMFCRGSL